MSSSARIVLTSDCAIASQPGESRYCFRASWLFEYESLYSILSKFALANVLGVQQLAALVMREAPSGSIKPVSLLDASQFNLDAISQLLRIDPGVVRSAFLTAQVDQFSSVWIAGELRYCPICIAGGYHSILFQNRYLSACPIHKIPLRTGCLNRRCRQVLDFRLTSPTFRYPYACPNCQVSLAVNLSLIKPSKQSLSTPEIARLASAADYIRQTQRLPHGTFINDSFDAQPESIEMVGGPPGRRVEAENEVPELVAAVHKITQSQEAEVENRGPNRVRLVTVRGILGKPKIETEARLKRSAVRKPCQEKSFAVWGGPWFLGDPKVQYAVETYRGIRRMIWRQLVGEHRLCVETAAKHIWWNARGLRSPPICCHAFAFLNWRMFWEGIGTPQHLLLRATHSPLGVVSWLSTSSPILSQDWSDEARSWITMRILAMECRWTFDSWAGIALACLDHNIAQWGDRWIPQFDHPRHWVGEVDADPEACVSIHFVHKSHHPTLPCLPRRALAAHQAWHLGQLATIVR